MDENRQQVPRRQGIVTSSQLHKRLGVTPGDIPAWLMSTHCEGFDLMVVIAGIPFFAGIACVGLAFGSSFWFVWLPLSVACFTTVGLLCWAMEKLYAPERLARARKKRGECIWCGAKNSQLHREGCRGNNPWRPESTQPMPNSL
jgi:hypothetical protein